MSMSAREKSVWGIKRLFVSCMLGVPLLSVLIYFTRFTKGFPLFVLILISGAIVEPLTSKLLKSR